MKKTISIKKIRKAIKVAYGVGNEEACEIAGEFINYRKAA